MNRSVLKNIVLSGLLFLAMAGPLWATEDAILAVVNDEVITLRDLKDYIHSTYVAMAAQGYSEEKIEEAMKDLEENGLNKIIEDKLMLGRANQLGMVINEKLIQDKIDEIKSNYPSEEMFTEALVAHGGTLSDMKKKITEQLKVKFAVDHEIRSKIYVSPREITEFYEAHVKEFQKNERINLESIFISFGSNKIAAKEKAKEALNLIQQDEDFKEVAMKYSDAPSLGAVERGQLMPAIEKTVFHLQLDVPSDLIELETGFYIFKLTGRLPAEVASLQEVKDDIRERLFRTKFRTLFIEWIDDLKEDAYIEIKE
ncbi:MAG TPA: peptidyl-prolyl cis-trans isomerase [Candidatus Omnitrophota bacterium]|nr:peptidyl-prolyl cis-trans isomerase [Candidatus Omnitrophota bacterium]